MRSSTPIPTAVEAQRALVDALKTPISPLERLRARLGRRTRITVPDGRVFVGFFVCVDRDCNLVLSSTEEFAVDKRRFIGNVLITKNNIVRAEMETFQIPRNPSD